MNFFEFDNEKDQRNVRNELNQDQNKNREKDDEKENLNNLSVAEGLEQNLNNQVEDANENQNESLAKIIDQKLEYNMKISKKEVKMKLEDKIQMELMRRFEVKISNIYITPLRDMIDPFIQFTIGGDYSVQVSKNKDGDTHKVIKGSRGFADKTEVLKNVDALEKRAFDAIICTELRMSYSMINGMKMMVELWDYNTIWMNTILGYVTINLIDIVNGNMNVSVEILKRLDKKKKPKTQALIEFKCIFQEIWDYNISLLNWKLENILSPRMQKDPNTELMNVQLSIEFEEKGMFQTNTIAKSEILEKCSFPSFSNFDNTLVFRGTSSSLESSNLVIKLVDHNLIYSRLIASRTVSLSGVLETERIKTDLQLIDPKTKDKYTVKVEGSMNIDCETKYEQTGENVSLISTKKYLCINIQRVENIRPAETRGIVDSFISVEYSGLTLRTKTVKENNNPSFNEILYFLIPIKEDYLKDINANVQKINEEFTSRNEVVFNLMIEGDDNTYDNLGICQFHLSDLKNSGSQTTKRYYADDLKKNKNYVTKVYNGKLKLVSAFSLSNNTYVNFEAWFLDDFPDTIDFGQKKGANERGDKIPIELKNNLGNSKEKDKFFDRFKKTISQLFRQYTNYSYKERSFYEVYQMDQYRNLHLLPYYISGVSLPFRNFTLNEINSNPLFFDYNLTTLDEIAHFVRCFPLNTENKGEVWSSIDYMIKIRKGGLEDHTILMANLMIGLKKIKRVNIEEFVKNNEKNETQTNKDEIGEETPGNENTKKVDINPNLKMNSIISDIFPYENKVFVCVGRMKYTRTRVTWVMTIGDDYRDVTFWDSRLPYKFTLFGRISDQEKMQNFLNMNYEDYDSIKKGITIVNTEIEEEPEEEIKNNNKDKNEFDKKLLPHLNDSASLKYEPDEFRENILNENDIFLQNYEDAGQNDKVKNLKQFHPIQADDYMLMANNEDNKKNKANFLEEQNQEIKAKLEEESDKYFLPVEEFKDRSGKSVGPIKLPYETIDVRIILIKIIFNKNNIYANRQYHDPAEIRYNLYEK